MATKNLMEEYPEQQSEQTAKDFLDFLDINNYVVLMTDLTPDELIKEFISQTKATIHYIYT